VTHWPHLPLHRLSKVMKAFLKPFVLCCPLKYYESTLGPFLSAVLKFLFNRISDEWERVKVFSQVQKGKTNESEGSESAEVREERSIYSLSKEFIDLLAIFCTFKRKHQKEKSKPADGSIEVLGKLGEFLLSYQGTNLTILCTIFTAVTWPDTRVAMKLSHLAVSIVKKVFTSGNTIDSTISAQLFMQLLKSLQVHGADEMSRSLLTNSILQVYIHLRMQNPELVKLMLMVPSCKEDELQAFDMSVFAAETPLTDNQRKKIFRSFVSAACGKTVSGLYKQNIEIKDLPALAARIKPNTSLLDETSEEAALCNLFNPAN